MHRLFSRVPKGLDPIADIFREHVDAEGMKLVKEAASAAETKREKEKDAGGWGWGPGVGVERGVRE
jgi:cullin 1